MKFGSYAYPISRALQTVMTGWTFGLVNVWKYTCTCLIHTNKIFTTGCAITHQTIRWKITVYSRAACCSGKSQTKWYVEIKSVIIVYEMRMQPLWWAPITYLHSYSTPLIDIIVRELSWSIPSMDGWRSPSLHCSVPHITFLWTRKILITKIYILLKYLISTALWVIETPFPVFSF